MRGKNMLQSRHMTKPKAKFIESLHLKKARKEKGLFLVEGGKSILELARSSFEILELYTTKEFYTEHLDILSKYKKILEIVESGELQKITTLEHNDTSIAIVKQKENIAFEIKDNDIIIALDDIRDPGNLGTIIRTADWYGVSKIVCSKETAEFYNPKVIAASMGSFTRVAVYYTDLATFFQKNKTPVIGAVLKGTSAHSFDFPTSGILLLGNESNGIHGSLLPLITHPVTIPAYGSAESLNVALATGILLDNWKRSEKA